MLVKIYIQIFMVPILFIFGQDSKCVSKETCRDCIQEINCVWCITLPNNQVKGKAPIHCVDKNFQSKRNWCLKDNIISPENKWSILQDDLFSSDNNKTIQIKPQRMKISLRKGEKLDLHFQYKQAENYPVDLYYLMDLSASMDKHRENLGRLGLELAKALKNITTNVQLGFGSFIDKVELPFTNIMPEKLKSPCSKNQPCAPPYSFKNHLSLTSNHQEFDKQVTEARVSGNMDSPEGGLDALMQAIVCKDEIHWRPQARHLLIFSTDAEFHIAGDGKLAGVIEPNDAKCHMDNNKYNGSLIYDYPSVSQINNVASENNINIIFAIVVQDSWVKKAYQKLSENIKNSKFDILSNGENDNVINLVLENYKKIVQSVRMTSNATDDIDIKFSSNCISSNNQCSNVHIGEIKNFTATIELRNCLMNASRTKIISIKPETLNESLIIEFDAICDCPCSSTTDPSYSMKSSQCGGYGDLKCGICECFPERFGMNCQCDNSTGMPEDISNCIMDGHSEICSGIGECKCGRCECNNGRNTDKRYHGRYCECDNYSCKSEGGSLCSGHGVCDCKVCHCDAGFTGDACQCPDSITTCIAPESDLVCSGYGTCNCGQCECNVTQGHSGKYCEECTTCPAQRCLKIIITTKI